MKHFNRDEPYTETYLELCQTSKMKLCTKLFSSLKYSAANCFHRQLHLRCRSSSLEMFLRTTNLPEKIHAEFSPVNLLFLLRGGGYGFVKTDKCGRPRTQKARFKYTSFLSLISFLSYGSLQNLLQMLCSLEAIQK